MIKLNELSSQVKIMQEDIIKDLGEYIKEFKKYVQAIHESTEQFEELREKFVRK